MRTALTTALALATFGAAPSAAHAQFGAGDFTTNGSATLVGGQLQLTSQDAQAGSAWLATPFTLSPGASFTAQFRFALERVPGLQVPDPQADGIAFAIHGSAAAGAALGAGGGNVGLTNGNVAPFLGLMFQTWDNNAIPVITDDGTGADPIIDGDRTPWPNAGDRAVNFFDVFVELDGATNLLTWTAVGAPGTFTNAGSPSTIDVSALLGSGDLYVGFTGGSGLGGADQRILSFTFETSDGFSFTSTPEPGTWALLATGLVGVVGLARRRRA